jgi:uncharacterized membrane protein HdeD (DUF308 family)
MTEHSPRFPRPNWWLFNRIDLLPAAGIFMVGAGVIQNKAWLIPAGIATAVAGTWQTMRRLTGRISERSLAWVLIETTIVLAGGAVVFALHLSGLTLFLAIAVPAIASELIATAVTGVREAE